MNARAFWPTRTLGGSRRYSDQDIEMLRRIQELTSAGLNLEGVERVIELEAEVGLLAPAGSQAHGTSAGCGGASAPPLQARLGAARH